MFKIETTKHNITYIAPKEVSQLIERQYDGGGTIIYLCNGLRVETYKHIDSVHDLIVKATNE
jgi:hypothetical protein